MAISTWMKGRLGAAKDRIKKLYIGWPGRLGTALTVISVIKSRPWKLVEIGGDVDFIAHITSWLWTLLDSTYAQIATWVAGIGLMAWAVMRSDDPVSPARDEEKAIENIEMEFAVKPNGYLNQLISLTIWNHGSTATFRAAYRFVDSSVSGLTSLKTLWLEMPTQSRQYVYIASGMTATAELMEVDFDGGRHAEIRLRHGESGLAFRSEAIALVRVMVRVWIKDSGASFVQSHQIELTGNNVETLPITVIQRLDAGVVEWEG